MCLGRGVGKQPVMSYSWLMEKQEEKELFVSCIGYSALETEIEAQIAENAGISREEYNRIIENDLEMPECIKKYRETIIKKMAYEEKILEARISEQFSQIPESVIEDITQEQNLELAEENVTPQIISEYVEREKMPPLIQKMYDDKVISGERINGRWVILKYKKGIKTLYDWAAKMKMPSFSNNYIVSNFCKPDGQPYNVQSINSYRWENALTDSKD